MSREKWLFLVRLYERLYACLEHLHAGHVNIVSAPAVINPTSKLHEIQAVGKTGVHRYFGTYLMVSRLNVNLLNVFIETVVTYLPYSDTIYSSGCRIIAI